jgi:Ca-activated chloride channel family protein
MQCPRGPRGSARRGGILGLVLAAGLLTGAASDDSARPRRLNEIERAEVHLVQLPIVVTDRQGRIVTDLDRDDFELFENDKPQRILHFSRDHALPLDLAFLLDLSGSMRQVGKLDEAKQAIRSFVLALGPGDRFGLIAFAGEQVAWITDFTDDRSTFLRRLEVQEAYGQTALYDALAAAPRLVAARTDGRRAIVLFTDGVDTSSTTPLFDALRAARSVEVPIYAFGFETFAARIVDSPVSSGGRNVVDLFAEETGGRLFRVFDPDEVKEAVLAIRSELDFRFLIAYQPSSAVWDGTFRRIRVETRNDRLQVRARRGYYAEP